MDNTEVMSLKISSRITKKYKQLNLPAIPRCKSSLRPATANLDSGRP